VSDFLVGLFALSDPSAARGNTITAREILDSGAARIETDLAAQPLVRARLMLTMGTAYGGLGRLDTAALLLDEALQTMVEQGAEELGIASAEGKLASVLVRLGEFDRAEALNREALVTLRQAFGDEYHPEVASIIHSLAFGFLRKDVNLLEGEMLLRALLGSQKAAGVLDSVELATTMDYLCWTLINKGDRDAANELCHATLALRRDLFEFDHSGTVVSLHRVGALNREQGRYEQALAAFREALAMNRRLYGGDHPETAYNNYALALTFRGMGEPDSALHHAREAVRVRRLTLPDDSPQLAEAHYELATVLRERGDERESADAFGEGLAVDELGLRHRTGSQAAGIPEYLRHRARYAAFLRQVGREAEAHAHSLEAQRLLDSAIVSGVLGPGTPPLTLNAVCWWGSIAGHAARVLEVCDAGVEASDEGNRPRIRDSRGVARAITGDYAGAITDFEAYIERPQNVRGVPQRREWVAALRRGENPFTQVWLDRIVLP
jgi:tetratricopeptide (TPR) repeat protein